MLHQFVGTHSLLRKLQFLFELPAKLKTCITEGNFGQGVAFYLRAQRVLEQVEPSEIFLVIVLTINHICCAFQHYIKNEAQNDEIRYDGMLICVMSSDVIVIFMIR
jgi:hypothetical protein